MASRIGMAIRNEAAENRIGVALEAIAATGHLDLSSPPEATRDEVLNETLRLESVADSLEAVLAAVSLLPSADRGAEPALTDLKRDELNAIAAELGIDAPEKLPNKPAVVEAIEAKQAELAASADPDPTDTDGDAPVDTDGADDNPGTDAENTDDTGDGAA